MVKFLAIFFAGGVGVLLRYILTVSLDRFLWVRYPWGTFCVNLLGCFFIGLIFVRWVEPERISPVLGAVLLTGFLGGFTTFSSFSLEAMELYRRGEFLSFATYFIGSPILGLGGVFLGMLFGREILV